MARNPDWTVEEIVLATELLVDNDFRVVGEHDPGVIELSAVLNDLPIHAIERRNLEFRSPSSIDRKLANIRSVNPNWTGGKTNAGRLDDYFWRVLGGEAITLRLEAAAIRAKYGVGNDVARVASDMSLVRDPASTDSAINGLTNLPIPEIHRTRLSWFIEHEGEILPYAAIDAYAHPSLISRPVGIYRPSGWEYALSVRETLASPYGDVLIRTLANGDWVYRYHRELGQDRSSNAGLLACQRDGIPVGVLIQVATKPVVEYFVAGLGRVQRFQDPWFDFAKWRGVGVASEDSSPSGQVLLASDARNLVSPRNETYSKRLNRPNQSLFRVMLLNSYGMQCAMTQSRVVPALEAAHIRPYKFDRVDSVHNGMLLRADVHKLFDQGLVGVNADRMEIVLSPALIGTEYESLIGTQVHIPKKREYAPSAEYLEEHRRKWNLG